MSAWPPQASYPCGNFSDTSSLEARNREQSEGSIGHAFAVCICTENRNQTSFCPFALREISVLTELVLGHLRYRLTDVPPQPNSPSENVFDLGRSVLFTHTPSMIEKKDVTEASLTPKCQRHPLMSQDFIPTQSNKRNIVQSSGISRSKKRVNPLLLPLMLHLQRHFTIQTKVKLNRVFFPR